MKPLVKTLNDYLTETLSPEEIQRLAELGLKTPLDDIDDAIDAIDAHISEDAEVQRLSAELGLRLKTLCSEFERAYEYSDEVMSETSEYLDERASGYGRIRTLDAAVANAVYKHLVT